MKIYHNTRCKKSRAGLQFLTGNNIEPEIILYLKDQPFTEKTLSNLLKKTKKTPLEMIRKQESVYKKEFKGKEFSETEWIKIMVENPKLIQRPIIETEKDAVLGDPVENISKLLQ